MPLFDRIMTEFVFIMSSVDFINYGVNFVVVLGNLLTYAIIGRVLISWFEVGNPYKKKGRFAQFLYDVTEPVMSLVKKLPHRIGMIDLSPIIAIFGIDIVVRLITEIIYKLAA